jgi:AraC-like DNA-binding protein
MSPVMTDGCRLLPWRGSVTRFLPLRRRHGFVVIAFAENPPAAHQRVTFVGESIAWFGVNLVVQGRGAFVDEAGRHTPLQPGSRFQRTPRVIHTTQFDAGEPYTECAVGTDFHTFQQLAGLGLVDPRRRAWDGELDHSIVDGLSRLAASLEDESVGTGGILLGAVQMIRRIYHRSPEARTSPSDCEWLARAKALLEVDRREPLTSIASAVHVGYQTFRQRFRELTGQSPGEYRIRKRIERACALLPTQSVKKTAYALGYCDPFTFSAQFKRYIGVSPREFQQGRQATASQAD